MSKQPSISPKAFVADSAVINGDVEIADGVCVLDGAILSAYDGKITLGTGSIVMENAVIRSSLHHPCRISSNVLIGPHTHISGCTIEKEVFVATGASVFNGAHIKTLSEIRINAIVHVNTVLEKGETVPIGWVAVGNPAQLFAAEKSEEIWKVQEKLGFPTTVFGLKREQDSPDEDSLIKKMTDRYAAKIIELRNE